MEKESRGGGGWWVLLRSTTQPNPLHETSSSSPHPRSHSLLESDSSDPLTSSESDIVPVTIVDTEFPFVADDRRAPSTALDCRGTGAADADVVTDAADPPDASPAAGFFASAAFCGAGAAAAEAEADATRDGGGAAAAAGGAARVAAFAAAAAEAAAAA
eukprot:Rhum_TRINITY_DN14440_c29_g1::Rhum_TRINITY_DN14440_c29_g1_i1::g.90724::m.90724